MHIIKTKIMLIVQDQGIVILLQDEEKKQLLVQEHLQKIKVI